MKTITWIWLKDQIFDEYTIWCVILP